LKLMSSWVQIFHLLLSLLAFPLVYPHRSLPQGPLIVGYANWNECDPKIITEVNSGVNVVIWFALNLLETSSNNTNVPSIEGGPNITCVRHTVAKLKDAGLETTHLISVGGWDAPRPSTSFSPQEWFDAWHKWNTGLYQGPDGLGLFDGLDWDLEGADNLISKSSYFNMKTLELAGHMSQLLKKAGYLVSLVPPESYLDCSTSLFNRYLTNSYPEWKGYLPSRYNNTNFFHHGRNVYAVLIAKWGITALTGGSTGGLTGGSTGGLTGEAVNVRTFDLISIQLYEFYTHAQFEIDMRATPASTYLQRLVTRMIGGWNVSFSSDSRVNHSDALVRVSQQQLVLGFSFGNSGGQSLYVDPKEIGQAYLALPDHLKPRGFMFWEMQTDGTKGNVNGTNRTVSFASEFNKILRVRLKVCRTLQPLIASDIWCTENCHNQPPYCPPSICVCNPK